MFIVWVFFLVLSHSLFTHIELKCVIAMKREKWKKFQTTNEFLRFLRKTHWKFCDNIFHSIGRHSFLLHVSSIFTFYYDWMKSSMSLNLKINRHGIETHFLPYFYKNLMRILLVKLFEKRDTKRIGKNQNENEMDQRMK